MTRYERAETHGLERSRSNLAANSRNMRGASMNHHSADQRIADALDEMNGHITEVRQCVETTRAKLMGYIPWIIVWGLILVMNFDDKTRVTIKSIAGAVKETAKLAQ